MQAAWVYNCGPPGSWYAETDSSFMQGSVYLSLRKKFKDFIDSSDLNDGKSHVLVLDGHASHATVDVLKYAMEHNIRLFQLPSHSSHITQPLDVCAFGLFKHDITNILTTLPQKNGMRMPVKSDIAGIVRDAWEGVFTPANISASFAGAGIFPIDKERAINRLSGRGTKRKERSFDRPPLADLLVVVNGDHIRNSLGRRAEINLLANGHSITGLRVNTVFFGAYLQEKERKVHPAIQRRSQGVIKGGLLTADKILAEYEEAEKKEEDGDEAKAARMAVREAKRVEKEAVEAAKRQRQQSSGRGSGRSGQTRGRGGGGAAAWDAAAAEGMDVAGVVVVRR